MKKLVSTFLTIALLFTTTTDAYYFYPKLKFGCIKNGLGGTWQVVKIGTGLALMCGGALTSLRSCTQKAQLKCLPCCCIDRCSNCCISCRFIVSASLILGGGYMVIRGVRGLKKIINHKKGKEYQEDEKDKNAWQQMLLTDRQLQYENEASVVEEETIEN